MRVVFSLLLLVLMHTSSLSGQAATTSDLPVFHRVSILSVLHPSTESPLSDSYEWPTIEIHQLNHRLERLLRDRLESFADVLTISSMSLKEGVPPEAFLSEGGLSEEHRTIVENFAAAYGIDGLIVIGPSRVRESTVLPAGIRFDLANKKLTLDVEVRFFSLRNQELSECSVTPLAVRVSGLIPEELIRCEGEPEAQERVAVYRAVTGLADRAFDQVKSALRGSGWFAFQPSNEI